MWPGYVFGMILPWKDLGAWPRLGSFVNHPAIGVSSLLLVTIHAAVRFGQQLFAIGTVFRIHRVANTKGKKIFTADFAPGGACQFAETYSSSACGSSAKARRDNHELIATHAGHIVIFTAGTLQAAREQAQNTISFQMSKTIIDLFEAIQVADHNSERSLQAAAASGFSIEMQKQGSSIGQIGQVIRG